MITRMAPAFSADSCNNFPTVIFVHDLPQLNASNTPMDKAITGSPNAEKIFVIELLLLFSIDKMDLRDINKIGTNTGRNALITDGEPVLLSIIFSSATTGTNIFFPANLAHQWPTSMAGIAEIIPMMINFP